MTVDDCRKNVKAAAKGAWVAVIVGALWVSVAWLFILLLLYARPAWLLGLWGGGALTWDQVQMICLIFVGAMKAGLFGLVLLAILLTVWARSLKHQQA